MHSVQITAFVIDDKNYLMSVKRKRKKKKGKEKSAEPRRSLVVFTDTGSAFSKKFNCDNCGAHTM